MSPDAADALYALRVERLDGRVEALAAYAGQVLLVVNVASHCGFTPQYAGLEQLWRDYRGRGLAVLGFPCNQFGQQEPGDAAAIGAFCTTRYEVSFPMFAKVEVNGRDAHPLFGLLRAALPGVAGSTAVKWNFTKFLVDRDGRPVRRFGPLVTPARLRKDIEALLARPADRSQPG
jgi:glutathione peroxidase